LSAETCLTARDRPIGPGWTASSLISKQLLVGSIVSVGTDFRNVEIGDVVPVEVPPMHMRPLWAFGEARWHIVVAKPQKEDAVVDWLTRADVYAFYPVRERRKLNQFGKQVVREVKYLPGYVFARFPGPAAQARVLASPAVSRVIATSAGLWGIVQPERLRRIYEMRPRTDEDDAAREKIRVAQGLKPGDRVRPLSGMWDGAGAVEVIGIRSKGKVVVSLPMFGAEVPVELSPENYEPVLA